VVENRFNGLKISRLRLVIAHDCLFQSRQTVSSLTIVRRGMVISVVPEVRQVAKHIGYTTRAN